MSSTNRKYTTRSRAAKSRSRKRNNSEELPIFKNAKPSLPPWLSKVNPPQVRVDIKQRFPKEFLLGEWRIWAYKCPESFARGAILPYEFGAGDVNCRIRVKPFTSCALTHNNSPRISRIMPDWRLGPFRQAMLGQAKLSFYGEITKCNMLIYGGMNEYCSFVATGIRNEGRQQPDSSAVLAPSSDNPNATKTKYFLFLVTEDHHFHYLLKVNDRSNKFYEINFWVRKGDLFLRSILDAPAKNFILRRHQAWSPKKHIYCCNSLKEAVISILMLGLRPVDHNQSKRQKVLRSAKKRRWGHGDSPFLDIPNEILFHICSYLNCGDHKEDWDGTWRGDTWPRL